jgi:membrane-associated phospholipid phosphatase
MFFLQTTASWFSGIEAIDRKLFLIINRDLSNGFFDAVLPFIRESNIWAPLYLFMLVFAVSNFGKRGWLWFLFAICTAALCDLVSSHLIKEHIFRLRPCQNPELAQQMHVLVNYCPTSSSFTSSHAANHFGLAVFVVLTMRRFTPRWINLFYAWAVAICFAQVYVGVHYPFDVISGGLLGWLLGYIMARFFNNYAGLISLQNKTAQ